MFLAKIIKKVVSVQKHEAYKSRTVFVVQPVQPDGTETGNEWVAVDYVGAGVGDLVVCGGAPGVSKSVFKLELAPIRTLIMAIVDKVDYRDIE
ncbi:MAG: EutN/CcmL family microcompartment protein [Bacteroidota bacterium]